MRVGTLAPSPQTNRADGGGGEGLRETNGKEAGHYIQQLSSLSRTSPPIRDGLYSRKGASRIIKTGKLRFKEKVTCLG